MDYKDLPKVKTRDDLTERSLCLIDGEEYPMLFGKIIRMMREGEQPRILVLADPGHGKTWNVGYIAETLQNELGVVPNQFDAEEQMKWDPYEFVQAGRKKRKSIIAHPDANTSFASDEYRSKGNRSNRDLIYLSRRFGNLLIYDAHEMAKCDKTIRTNHNIRIVSVGNADSYRWHAYRIKRKNDTMKEEIEKISMGTFSSKKPSDETVERIESMDDEKKVEKLKKREEEWEREKASSATAAVGGRG